MYNNHNHTEYSNALLGFPDVICRVNNLIQKAYDIGLDGITITEHEGISSHIKALKYYNNMEKTRPFKLGLGNEIYLLHEDEDMENRNGGSIPYYHFVLTALDTMGHQQIRELSSMAWNRAYKKFIYRRPTYYSDLEKIIKPNQGHVIASTACLGSRIDKLLLSNNIAEAINEIKKLIEIFGVGNLYLECQPAKEEGTDQSKVNRLLKNLMGNGFSNDFELQLIPTTDSHYLSKEEGEIHKVYLNSQEGDREVDDFYATAYLMSEDELRDYLRIDFTDKQIDQMYKWSCELGNRIQDYDILHNPIIPQIPENKIPSFQISHKFKKYYSKYPSFKWYSDRESLQEQYFFYQIENSLQSKVVEKNKDIEKYIARLNEEWTELKIISEELNTSMASYYSTMSAIIELIWEADSLAMPARGSAAGFLTCYLLEVTQIDPVPLGDYMPSWRHLNHERGVELPDIDNDSEASKKKVIVDKMKEFFGVDKVLNVATFSKISSKIALEKACKGLGISDDISGYLKTLIPVNRGNVSSLSEAIYGDKEKGVTAVAGLKSKLKEYHPMLEKCALGIEGLITNRGTHAAGVIVCNTPYTDYIAAMRSADGTLETSYDLWDAEEAGCIKFDMLTITAADKIHQTLNYLLKYNKIEWQGSLKATYYKYIHPEVLNYTDEEMWKILPSIYSVFQFDTPISQKTLSATHPCRVMDLSSANSLLRLMPENADETPIDRYKRYKEDYNEWLQDTLDYGLNESEQQILWHYLSDSYGLAESQEKVMRLSMDKNIAGYSLKEANKLRKAIAKKNKKLQEEAKTLFFDCCKRQNTREIFADYVWNVLFSASMGYSFSQLHSYSYSIIALQELNLNYFYNPVYWNCACLSIESTGIKDNGDGEKQETGSIDYGEVAKAIYKIRNNGIVVSAPSINHSDINFTPDESNNTILFGLGGIAGINRQIAQQIINNRPYKSLYDFFEKNSYDDSLITPSKYIQLIKSGCFDEFSKDKTKVMKEYFQLIDAKPTSLKLGDIARIKSVMHLPKNIFAPYNFYKYTCSKEHLYGIHPNFKSKKLYWLDNKSLTYFDKNCRALLKENVDYWIENDRLVVVDKSLEKLLKPSFTTIQEYINQKDFIDKYYDNLIESKMREKLSSNDTNRWSFEAVSYYPEDHELIHLDLERYNIEHFKDLPETSQFVEKSARGRSWKQYELSTIVGTCISKNDNHHYFTILTVDNEVVNCNINQGAYAHYKAQLSEVIDGKKEVIEKPWIARGSLLILCGYRRGEDFVCKKYSNSLYRHQIQKIHNVYEDGSAEIQMERWSEE